VATAFDVGSILKDLTAAAVYKLAGQGALARTRVIIAANTYDVSTSRPSATS
jgi:hypothetical protein